MFRKKKDNSIENNYIDVKNLPILILDSKWLKLFPKEKQTSEMQELESELRELLKEQARLNEQIKKLTANKKSILSKILTQSNEVVEKGRMSAKNDLALSQENVNKINETLSQIRPQADALPEKIEKVNNRLFQLSVKIAYNKMAKNLKEVRKHEDMIDKLREQLSDEVEKKEKLESNFKSSKEFLLDYIGKDGLRELESKYNGSI